ncbi:hypothetical protein [Sinorhizobium meliloti]|uniref:hypothetical protein n=1 Tax=Rhizobium meliloti TaxID=382 RepID=UPI001F1ABA9D|nr:hypothetical protein [Sinorhizobium meliloti]
MFAHDIVGALQRQIGFRRQGATIDDAAVEEFLAAAICIPSEDFVALVGIDAGSRDAAKRAMSKMLAEGLTAEFEIVSDPQRYTRRSGPTRPSRI